MPIDTTLTSPLTGGLTRGLDSFPGGISSITVLNASGTPFSTPLSVLNAAGTPFTVTNSVRNAAGTSFTVV